MFTFPNTPVEELKEKKEYPLLDAGDYLLKIVEVENKTSKKGNAMLKLTLTSPGTEATIFDYLVNQENMAWKWHHLFVGIGQEEVYLQGNFNINLLKGKMVMTRLLVKESEEHGTQNKVKDYLPRKDSPFGIADNLAPPPFDDDINF